MIIEMLIRYEILSTLYEKVVGENYNAAIFKHKVISKFLYSF